MLGAIAGDVIGSVYERHPIKTTEFPLLQPWSRFTDDTVLTVAVAHAILRDEPYAEALKQFGRRYPDAGYGGTFYEWLSEQESLPYGSWGNGSAMRVSPVGFAFDTPEDVLQAAAASAAVTHNHPEGIKGAQATALAVFLARKGANKEAIRQAITERCGYDLDRTLADIRPTYEFDVSCQGSVPEAIIAFLEADDFEGSVRNAISLGGDADTMACIAGAIAEPYYTVPEEIEASIRSRLPWEFLVVLDEFQERYDLR